jgi:protein tyrosine phosphatase (PTP) superfamily phosphohydrolase (DUF442 family)
MELMHITVRHLKTAFLKTALLLMVAAGYAAPLRAAEEIKLQAPNVVPISPLLVTSGQPTAQALGTLAAQGYGAVIYLAPLTVSDAVPAEADIVRKQGLEFINIPIEFGSPTDADFKAFVAALNRLKDRKVLVHCQINMRASSMTFLYRVIARSEKPELAYESVSRVWSPRGVWKDLLVTELRKANIAFDPY